MGAMETGTGEGSDLPRHVVVMGVAGTGKTSIGRAIAERLGAAFVEGDEYHPQANIEKMSSGQPLDDEDRRPWLTLLADRIRELDAAGERSVTACSALRRLYRDWLREGHPDLFFVHLHTDYDVLFDRMQKREHFMPPALLQSQFDTLEMLEGDEAGQVVDVRMSIEEVVREAMEALRSQARS
jgi:gluconokinase